MTRNPVLVFGSGRSGTTWVQDVLAEANTYDTVFEPLHPDAVRGVREYANLYLVPGDSNPALRSFLEKTIAGNLHSIWTRLRARPDRLLPPLQIIFSKEGAGRTKAEYVRTWQRWRQYQKIRQQPKVIKFIRANLLIEWILQEFDCKACYVDRHPCAVLSSVVQRHGNEWELAVMQKLLHRYLTQDNLVGSRLVNKVDFLNSLDSMAGIHTAIWCIENAHIIASDMHDGLALACYEHLIVRKNSAWPELVHQLGLTNVPGPDLLSRPSQQARYSMDEHTSAIEQVSTWETKLDASDKTEVQRVLDVFEVDFYSTEDVLPSGESKAGSGS